VLAKLATASHCEPWWRNFVARALYQWVLGQSLVWTSVRRTLLMTRSKAPNVGQVGHLSALKRILAPTDLSLDSRKSVRYAIALAEHSMLK
jgi:hypothetical protein